MKLAKTLVALVAAALLGAFLYDLYRDLVMWEFMPHGQCIRWEPWVLWPRVSFHGVIATSYGIISISMAQYLRSKPDVSFPWVAWGFVAFIAACGLTHAAAIFVNWNPAYRAENILLGVTAILSGATAYYVRRYLPSMMEIPTVQSLQRQMQDRDADLRRLQDVLTELRAGKGA